MRLKFKKAKQKELLAIFKEENNFTWKEFAKFLKVKEGALKGWYGEQILLPLSIYQKIKFKKNYKRYIITTYKENWGKHKGGLNSKGSLKEIKIPKKCKELAELIGIILGDGNIHYFSKGKNIGTYMLRIAGDKRHDYIYLTKYVSNLIKNLFGIETKIYERKSNEFLIIAHSKKLIEFFINMGLKKGNKIKNQATIPKWIFENKNYIKACIRGLIDTDGCIYTLKPYYPNYYQLSFRNNNKKLLKDLRKAFLILGYPISNISKYGRLYLTQKFYIDKFYKEIGFSNEKHIRRYSPVV